MKKLGVKKGTLLSDLHKDENIIDSFEFVMSDGEHFSSMTTIPKSIPIYRHKDIDRFIDSGYGYDADDSDFFFYDGTGKEQSLSKSKIIENIKSYGVWGMVLNDEELHMWYDEKLVCDKDLYRFISHELGHFQRPFKRDPDLEEMKAEHYSDFACVTHNMVSLLKDRFNTHDLLSDKIIFEGELFKAYKSDRKGDFIEVECEVTGQRVAIMNKEDLEGLIEATIDF